MFLFVCVCGGDWAREKLTGRVQPEGHSPRRRVLHNFSIQPWGFLEILRGGRQPSSLNFYPSPNETIQFRLPE